MQQGFARCDIPYKDNQIQFFFFFFTYPYIIHKDGAYEYILYLIKLVCFREKFKLK